MLLLVVSVIGFGVSLFTYRTLAAEKASPAAAELNQAKKAPQNHPPTANPKSDKNELQGAWILVSGTEDGVEKNAELLKKEGHRLTFKGDKLTYKRDDRRDQTQESDYKLDPAKTPKAIDLVPTDGPHKGETMPAIYKLDGDKLTICMGAPGAGRPTEFVIKPGLSLLTCKRTTPPKRDPKNEQQPKVEKKGNTLAVKNVLLRSVNAKRNTISVTIGAQGKANAWLDLGDLYTLLPNQKDKNFISLGLFVGTADGRIAFIPMHSAQLENLPVAKNAKIVLDGKESKLADLKADSFMTFQLATDGEKIEVREIHAGK